MRRGRTRTPCRSGRAPSAVRGAGEHREVSPNCATRQGAGHATGPPTRICRAETLVRFAAGRVRGSGEGATGALRAPSQRRRAQKGAARWGWRMSQSGRRRAWPGPQRGRWAATMWSPPLRCRTYEQRNVVEPCINRLKQWPRLTTRTDRFALACQSALCLAAILIGAPALARWSAVGHSACVRRPGTLAHNVIHDSERLVDRHDVLVRVPVLLPVGQDEPTARSIGPGVHSVFAGIPSFSSSITIARSVFVTTANDRPDELVSHVSSCPRPILARRISSTTSGRHRDCFDVIEHPGLTHERDDLTDGSERQSTGGTGRVDVWLGWGVLAGYWSK